MFLVAVFGNILNAVYLAHKSSYQDFESERKWKLAQAKKVALRATKGMLDQATRGEKRMKVLFSSLMQ